MENLPGELVVFVHDGVLCTFVLIDVTIPFAYMFTLTNQLFWTFVITIVKIKMLIQ
jgi:hypothetical protein